MSCRDRTSEFGAIVRSLQSVPNQRNPSSHQPSDFMKGARQIGYELNCTLAKLEKLTELARGRSLFGDPAAEIQELTQIIKQDIAKINTDIAALQELSKTRTYRDSRQVKSHSGGVVIFLQTKLANMSKEFKSVLEMRTQNLKMQKQRREQFSSAPVATTFTPSQMVNGDGSPLLMGSGQSSDISIDMDSVARNRHHVQVMEQQDTYIQERADAMENINATIIELGQIFRQLAEMVQEQEEQVVRIDTNVTETQLNVEAAHSELLKYFKGVTSNRWLMIKIFGVIIVFFVIFIIFLT